MRQAGPNPGSEEAQRQGCICAVMDNNHGRFAPYPPDGWWITQGCVVHAPVMVWETPKDRHSPEVKK
jgi:hypothetical protein